MPSPPAWPNRTSGPITSFRAYSTRRSLRPWRARSRGRPSGPASPAAARAPTRPSGPERVRDVAETRWSVIIPAYNEALRLPAYLGEVVAYFDGRDEPYEILVVDDGSRDETAARVLEAQAAHASVTLHRLAANHGKGFAVRAGMRAARGELRLMADADGATAIGEVKRLEAAIHAGADVAVGSRALPHPSVSRPVRPPP